MNQGGSLNNVFLRACQNGILSQIAQNLFNVVDTSDTLDTNVVEKVDGNTGLILAVRENHEDVVRFLLENTDIDVNVANKFGYTALMLAAQNGNTNIINMLLQQPDIDIDLVNKAGRKAEDCGRKKHSEVVKDLITQFRKRKLEDDTLTEEEPLRKIVVLENNMQEIYFSNIIEEDSPNDDYVDDISDDLKTILSARLENCLIDLGSISNNTLLCKEMYKMATKMGLSDLANICKKTMLESLNVDTVFTILEVLKNEEGVKDICLNFIVANIDQLKMTTNWKENLKSNPDITVELIDRL